MSRESVVAGESSCRQHRPHIHQLSFASDHDRFLSDLQATIPRRQTLPELLAMRERSGIFHANGKGHSVTDPSRLAYRSAWNTSRMNNMILSVGPTTPASIISMEKRREHAMHERREQIQEQQNSRQEDDGSRDDRSDQTIGDEINFDSEDENDDQISVYSEEGEESVEQATNDLLRARRSLRDSQSMSDNDDEVLIDESSDEEFDYGPLMLRRENYESTTDFSPTTAMKHGGCINTASWMDCGWNLSSVQDGSSLSSHNSPYFSKFSEDCPTQVLTSGDDRLVKLWDLRPSMGHNSQWSGGVDTVCPFSSITLTREAMPRVRHKWYKRSIEKRIDANALPGSVLPLSTLRTGHMGNVFDVSAIKWCLGKVATCAADGFMRIVDMETGNSSVVISPEFDGSVSRQNFMGFLAMRPAMCFSHHFLTNHTGLLCSERGLRRFDSRLAPQEQQTESLVDLASECCKACAIYSSTSSAGGGDSAYVFAGGSGPSVSLFDLRMTRSSGRSRQIQKYEPSQLSDASSSVSLSGLDLSEDNTELLVSYQSDAVYTFPVFPRSSQAGPSLEEIDQMHTDLEKEGNQALSVSEIASYGGHLNRLTFLKNAKFAGPRSSFICSGSDSGHAWIYEKATGTVASYMLADNSTCNGVIPHPKLPYFLSYGIANTALLWRASLPVDSEVDDSPQGRARFARDNSSYEMSYTTKFWTGVKDDVSNFDTEFEVYPDQMSDSRRHGSALIGNNMANLPKTIHRNMFETILSAVGTHESLMASGSKSMAYRVALIRLRHHADRLGLQWNPLAPWVFRKRSDRFPQEDTSENDFPTIADLVPDHPSDLLPLLNKPENHVHIEENEGLVWRDYLNLEDTTTPFVPVDWHLPWLDKEAWVGNTEDCDEFLDEAASKEGVSKKLCPAPNPSSNPILLETGEDIKVVAFSFEEDETSSIEKYASKNEEDQESGGNRDEIVADQFDPRTTFNIVRIVTETMIILKNYGNIALQRSGKEPGDSSRYLFRAAGYYDKAIQYAAYVLIRNPTPKWQKAESKDYRYEWGDLIKTLVATRLNLALLFIKPEFDGKIQHAVEQSRLALSHLAPFCKKKGKIVPKKEREAHPTSTSVVQPQDTSDSTYDEATKLQIKAYFRLGSAYLQLGNHSSAASALEKCMEVSTELGVSPDKLMQRRLLEAKRHCKSESKRQRRKLEREFGALKHQRKKPSPNRNGPADSNSQL